MPYNDYPKTKCRGCGRAIIWGQTEAGAKIPLDAIAPVYQVIKQEINPITVPLPPAEFKAMVKNRIKITVARADGFVSHFSTCSKASDFSKAKKEAKETSDAKNY